MTLELRLPFVYQIFNAVSHLSMFRKKMFLFIVDAKVLNSRNYACQIFLFPKESRINRNFSKKIGFLCLGCLILWLLTWDVLKCFCHIRTQ